MASIVDSIRSVYTDNFSILKIGVVSFVIYIFLGYLQPNFRFNLFSFIIIAIIISIYLAFTSIIINNRINQNIEVLPTFNLVKFVMIAIQSILLFIPYAFISFICVGLVFGLFRFEGLPQQIAIWLVRFVVFCAFIASFINYSQKNVVADGLNIPKMISALADVVVYTIIGILLLAICSIFSALPTLFLIYTFFKFGPIFQYFAIFFITLNLAFMGDYWGQLHYDIQSKDNFY